MLGLPDRGEATRLLLVRHEEPDESMRGRCYGHLDVPLSAAGRQRAGELGAVLSELPLTAVYSSPLSRSLGTAAAIAAVQGLDVLAEERLREIDFGELEGLTYDEVRAEHPDVYRAWMETPTRVRFPGGEAFTDLQRRVLAAAAEIRSRHDGEAVAIVAHGGVVRVVLADALGLADEAIFRLGQSHGGVNVVDWLEEAPVVRLVNAVLYSRA
jgi:broad specificity phosphatase PhoE